MTRIILMSIVAAMAAAGCTSAYRVHINGYSELTEPLDRTAPMYVETDPNSENPIFQRQIKAKAERLLHDEGYAVTDTPKKATYEMAFRVGTISQEVMDNSPIVDVRAGFYGGYGRGRPFFGPMAYIPYYDTEYRQWLILRLFRRGQNETAAKQLVWVGEATMEADRAAIRQAVNYLLVACLDHLGVDTREAVTVTIKKDDPRVMEIAAD
jgi:hypothetical protein